MTIEQAIIHAEEVADRCAVTDGNRQCEAEHRQLAAWLRELQERRKAPEIIYCKDCADWGTEDCLMAQDQEYWTNPYGYCHFGKMGTNADD